MRLLLDLLTIAALVKLIWESINSSLLPNSWLFVGIILIPILMGFGGRFASEALGEGIRVASLAIFYILLSIKGMEGYYIFLVLVAFGIYLFARSARFTLGTVGIAAILIFIIFYTLHHV